MDAKGPMNYQPGDYIEVTDRTGTHACFIESVQDSILMAVAVDGAYHPCRDYGTNVSKSTEQKYREEAVTYINSVIKVYAKQIQNLKNLELLIKTAPDINALREEIWTL